MERFMDDDMLVEHGKDTTQMWVKYEDCVQELSLTKADAQATIAALQARVKELEQWVQDQSTANLEIMRHTDEMQSRAMEAEQQLTQRTAELEAAKGSIEAARRVNNDLQAELERVRLQHHQGMEG